MIHGERREVQMDVGLKDVTDEQYALRAQDELGLCVGADGTVGEAKRADDLVDDLLSHARDGQRLHHARLHGAPLNPSMALAIALDIAFKTAWRYSVGGERAGRARRARFVEIFRTAALCDLDGWVELSGELPTLNDPQLMARLSGEPLSFAAGRTPPLALYALYCHLVNRAVAESTADNGWLLGACQVVFMGEGGVGGGQSLLSEVLASLTVRERDASALATLLSKMKDLAIEQTQTQAVGGGGGGGEEEEAFEVVDSMVM